MSPLSFLEDFEKFLHIGTQSQIKSETTIFLSNSKMEYQFTPTLANIGYPLHHQFYQITDIDMIP